VLNALVLADAAQQRIPLQQVDVSTRSTDPDAGIDARVEFPTGSAHDLLAVGENVLQYKAGKLTKRLLSEEFRKSGVQKTLQKGGHYLFCAGRDYVSKDAKLHANTLSELCRRSKIPAGQVKIIFGSAVARWICRYPAIVARPELRKHVRTFITVERWANDNPQMSNPFRADESRKATIEQIHTFLQSDSPEQAVLRLEGPAGVGKTRLVLQAVNKNEYANRALYAINADNVEVQPFLMEVYGDPETCAIAVIDECSRTKQSILQQYAQLSKGRLKLICVGVHEVLYDTPAPSLTALYQLRPLPDADIESIIHESYPGAPKDYLDMAVRLSGGYVKLAMFITAALSRFGTQPPVELTKVMEIQEFLRRFVDKETRQALQVLSVLAQIGWYEDLRDESKRVARFLRLPMATLEKAIDKLQGQGVVIAKGRYLYVSPDLLAIQAAADLWREKDYRLLDLIAELNSPAARRQLLIRLATMGEYPKMKDAVGKIMSTSGLFPALAQLDQEFLSEVFRILSSAVPLSATDLLVDLVVPATKDELSNFNTGRRNVLWAVESLLRWPETSMKAARVAMKFALSETEKISNNATSVFEQFFQMFLSGSPVPLMDRFVLIDELLGSGDNDARKLAAQAVTSSLQSHETRFGGDTDYLSKRTYPPEWKPKTYDEVWQASRKALGYLEQIAAGNDEAATLARRERLRSLYTLAERGQIDDAIRILETTIPTNDEERRIRLASCDQLNGNPNLSDAQRSKVNQIRESTFGVSYFERLRRWVGSRLPGDFHGSRAFEVADQKVLELAEEGFKNDIGIAELEWLSSSEAENVWLLGRRLGELDTPGNFRERIMSFAPNNVNCMLLASYISGRGIVAGVAVREQLIDTVAQQKPDAAFGATWRSEPTIPGADRIIRLVSEGRIEGSKLRMLMYGGWVEKLGPDYAARIVKLMLTSSPQENTEAALGIIDHAVHSGAMSAKDFGELIWDALAAKIPQRSPMFDWYWGRVAELIVELDPARFAQLFVSLFESDKTWLSTDSAQSAVQHAMRVNPVAVWEVIAPFLLSNDLTGVRIRLKLEQWFGDLVPPDVLVAWAQRHGRRAFLIGASLLNVKSDKLSPAAKLLIIKAPKPAEVLDQLLANLQSGSFVGPMSSHMEGHLARLQNWANDDDPRIRMWAEKAIAYARKDVKRQKLLEEEGIF